MIKYGAVKNVMKLIKIVYIQKNDNTQMCKQTKKYINNFTQIFALNEQFECGTSDNL